MTTAFIGEVEKLKAKFVYYESNVCHTAKVLSKKFTMPAVSDFEKGESDRGKRNKRVKQRKNAKQPKSLKWR